MAKTKGIISETTDVADAVFRKIDRLSSITKLALVAVSGYLVYRKYKKEVGLQLPPELQQVAQRQPAAGATKPLVEQDAQTLPLWEPTQQVAYQPPRGDQVQTAQALQTTNMRAI